MKTDFRRNLRAGSVLTGAWVMSGSPAVAALLDQCGFDWIAFDCEHTDIGLNQMAALTDNVRRCTPFVRVAKNAALDIRQALDNGAGGVIVPMVESAEDARAAVAAARFPPEGIRGFGYCRANAWGIDFDEYAQTANQSVCVVVMIETAKGAENIDAILEVDGVDGVFVGPYDLSGSYGVPGQLNHPRVSAAQENILAACARHGKAAGLHLIRSTREEVHRQLTRGFTFVALEADMVMLRNQAALLLEMTRGGK